MILNKILSKKMVTIELFCYNLIMGFNGQVAFSMTILRL